MPQGEIDEVMDWIKSQVVAKSADYCWKETYDRGVGLIPDGCPRGKEKIGALCYSKCPSGYGRFELDCHQICPRGFESQGLYCRKTEYWRDEFPWIFGDPILHDTDQGQWRRCESKHGKGNCEKYGLIVYAKCKSGYDLFGCCICRPRVNCKSSGLGHQLDLSCAKKIIIGDPTPMVCSKDKTTEEGLCYNPCRKGYYGVFHLCWSHCGTYNLDCAAACAKNEEKCALGVLDHIVSVLTITANVVTLGLATPVTATASRVFKIAGRLVEISKSNKLGNALADLAESLQKAADVTGKGARVVQRVVDSKTGKLLRTTFTVYEVSMESIEMSQFYRDAYSAEFATQTTPEVASTIDKHFSADTAFFLKGVWADSRRIRGLADCRHSSHCCFFGGCDRCHSSAGIVSERHLRSSKIVALYFGRSVAELLGLLIVGSS